MQTHTHNSPLGQRKRDSQRMGERPVLPFYAYFFFLPISIYMLLACFGAFAAAFAAYSVQHLHLKWIMAITLRFAAAAAAGSRLRRRATVAAKK